MFCHLSQEKCFHNKFLSQNSQIEMTHAVVGAIGLFMESRPNVAHSTAACVWNQRVRFNYQVWQIGELIIKEDNI